MENTIIHNSSELEPENPLANQSILQKFTNVVSVNKKYIFGLIFLALLGGGYMFYIKRGKLNDSKKVEPDDKKQDEDTDKLVIESPLSNEFILLQKQLMDQHQFSQQLLKEKNMLEHQILKYQQHIQSIQQPQQQPQQQTQQQQPQQQSQQPMYNSQLNNNDVDLDRVQSKEGVNISRHNLTSVEIDNIHKKLDL